MIGLAIIMTVFIASVMVIGASVGGALGVFVGWLIGCAILIALGVSFLSFVTHHQGDHHQ